MYYNKKRTKVVALLGVALLLGVCGCDAEIPEQEEQKQESVVGTVTEAVGQKEAEITKAITAEDEEATGKVKPTEVVGARPGNMEHAEGEKTADTGEEEPADTAETQPTDTEEPEVTDALKEMEPEELVLHVLTNAEGVYFTSGGVGVTELVGYAEENNIAYFILKKEKGLGELEPRGETVYVGVLNPETGELLQHYCYGNTTSDAVMIERKTGLYILYATECIDFGFCSGRGGVLLAKDGTLTSVWPLTPEGEYDDSYWTLHTAKLNGEVMEIYKVIITEVGPDGIANEMITKLERTVTLDEILAGVV